jgi:putative endonuclease
MEVLEMSANWYVYLVRCSDNSLYCGATTDPVTRILRHNHGRGAKYVRGRTPVTLVAVRGGLTKSAALKLEAQVKRKKSHLKIAFLEGSGGKS